MLDLRNAPVRNRSTTFRIAQDNLIGCAFGDFVPGCEGDPDPDRTFAFYRTQARNNMLAAAAINFPAVGTLAAFNAADIQGQAWGKVAGDMYEILEAAALWNAAAAWNQYMDSGAWPIDSTFVQPPRSIATPMRRVAIVELPRGYDSIRLLTPAARATYEAFQQALESHGMQLKLSSPDIVGLRIPDPMPSGYAQFLQPLPDLSPTNLLKLQRAHADIEGTIEGRNFLFAIAVKTSTRSDRLYQPLFEANVLKFIIGFVLRGSALKFHVHMEDFEGANVRQAYTAASLYSLMLGGDFARAVDHLYQAKKPRDTAQAILDTFPEYAI
ncbi:Cfr10I/Bse634I restriction endonuclease [Sphingobium chlorophenolicum L-1]|uniref:Cfr10I/Bse634I restriction endonuclease n=1 Tax=Sphingobium chlorophenolicum L-1 TaxID=690566 RepID=F6EYC0_SPHCR|nr:Cfr10I/Bse634I family restriction endonuclease [Sphingobium chlorophenolicum]AEG50073.1 Cfr10I/Bse634I restriction endonuclease [Sphingobium chlorophenolicum L-1]